MRLFKSFLHIAMVLTAGASLVTLGLMTLPLLSEREEATERFLHTENELAQLDAKLQGVESKLLLLTTSLDAVEREVRSELRMIKPGEKLILLEYEGSENFQRPVHSEPRTYASSAH